MIQVLGATGHLEQSTRACLINRDAAFSAVAHLRLDGACDHQLAFAGPLVEVRRLGHVYWHAAIALAVDLCCIKASLRLDLACSRQKLYGFGVVLGDKRPRALV